MDRYRHSQARRNIILSIFIISSLPAIVAALSSIHSDYSALKEFKDSSNAIPNLRSWVENSSPCRGSWYGVTCQNGRVTSLVLENMQLKANISYLTSLDELRVLSLKNNALNGSLPDVSSWKKLKLLYLSQNQFTGVIPDSISTLSRLWRFNLSNNKLIGSISTAFNSLDLLLTLRLENNQLSGSISSLNLSNLQDFNVSHNKLTGAIPASLSSFPISAFQGNLDLCGLPLYTCQTAHPSSSEPFYPSIVPSTPSSNQNPPRSTRKSDKLSRGAVIAIVVGDFAVILFVISILLLYYFKKYSTLPRGKHLERSQSDKLGFLSSQYPAQILDGDKGNLVFIGGTKYFELEELLRASAEMLGKGNLGTAYRAVLENGCVVTVKRLKDIHTLGRKEFEQHMEIIGRIRHPNLVSLRAYYYGRDEKLLVYDYMPNGSLFSLLHGNRGPGRVPLDWTTRMKIALDAARGLACIHHECKYLKVPHGNIKSSNVLLDKDGNASLSDFGLIMMANTSVVTSRLVGYRAPEHIETKKVSQRADVYSFGVLLLEILTGKAPRQTHLHDDGIDLPKWVQSVVREEWTSEVFDLELLRYKNIEEELVAMLQIAIACVSVSPKLRPRMSDVVRMIEGIKGEQSPQREDSFDSSTLSPSVSEGTIY